MDIIWEGADCLEMAGRIFRRAGDPSLSEWDGFAVDHPVHAAEFVRAWSCCEELFFFRYFISSILLKVTPKVMSLAMATWLDILEAKSVPWWSKLQT